MSVHDGTTSSAEGSSPHHMWDEQVKRGHRRKNTRRWCRGKFGVLHIPVVVIPANSYFYSRSCREVNWLGTSSGEREPRWLCSHKLICSTCGKVLEWSVRCPDKPEGMRQRWLKEDEA